MAVVTNVRERPDGNTTQVEHGGSFSGRGDGAFRREEGGVTGDNEQVFGGEEKAFGRPASSSSSSSSSSELDDEGAVAGPEAGAEAELAPLLATYPYCRPVGRRAAGEEHEKTVMTGGRGRRVKLCSLCEAVKRHPSMAKPLFSHSFVRLKGSFTLRLRPKKKTFLTL